MKRMLLFTTILLLLILSSSLYINITFVHSTTWIPVKKTDPITGDEVIVYETVSFGGYIFNWPSKYDLIFWPWTDENWIWFCPKSGYGSFAIDFDKLSEQEKKHLSEWLKIDPLNPPKTHKDKLFWLEKIYTQRNVSEEFWLLFYRLMAFINQNNPQVSIEYVNKAIPLLEKKLDEKRGGVKRIEVLYLLGEYNRRLGQEEKAVKYFDQAKKERYVDKDGMEKIGHPYFLSLISDREKMLSSKSGVGIEKKQRVLYVNWPVVSLREGPGLNFKIIFELKKGTILTVIEEQEHWFRVKVEDGLEGWVGKATVSETP